MKLQFSMRSLLVACALATIPAGVAHYWGEGVGIGVIAVLFVGALVGCLCGFVFRNCKSGIGGGIVGAAIATVPLFVFLLFGYSSITRSSLTLREDGGELVGAEAQRLLFSMYYCLALVALAGGLWGGLAAVVRQRSIGQGVLIFVVATALVTLPLSAMHWILAAYGGGWTTEATIAIGAVYAIGTTFIACLLAVPLGMIGIALARLVSWVTRSPKNS